MLVECPSPLRLGVWTSGSTLKPSSLSPDTEEAQAYGCGQGVTSAQGNCHFEIIKLSAGDVFPGLLSPPAAD